MVEPLRKIADIGLALHCLTSPSLAHPVASMLESDGSCESGDAGASIESWEKAWYDCRCGFGSGCDLNMQGNEGNVQVQGRGRGRGRGRQRDLC